MSQSPLVQSLENLVGLRAFHGLALLGLSNFIIIGAWTFQIVGGLAPCPLCLDQRVPWYLLIFVSSALSYGLFNGWTRQVLSALFVVAIGLALWAAYEGLFHAGVEYAWWKGPATCTGGGVVSPTLDLDKLRDTVVPMCDVVPWSLFGISLAGFNFLFSLAAAGLGLLGLLRALKG
jgi:disulfide bond formation protein DsbB